VLFTNGSLQTSLSETSKPGSSTRMVGARQAQMLQVVGIKLWT
jgi:hypothetical protein